MRVLESRYAQLVDQLIHQGVFGFRPSTYHLEFHSQRFDHVSDQTRVLIGELLLYELEFFGIDHDYFAALPQNTHLCADELERIISGLPATIPRLYLQAITPEDEDEELEYQVIGDFRPGQRCLLVSDFSGVGELEFQAITALIHAGLDVKWAITFFDQRLGARTRMIEAGIQMNSILVTDEVECYFRTNYQLVVLGNASQAS